MTLFPSHEVVKTGVKKSPPCSAVHGRDERKNHPARLPHAMRAGESPSCTPASFLLLL
nr:MAG TPA: hypothetical protein [Caudoviricetes sp.]